MEIKKNPPVYFLLWRGFSSRVLIIIIIIHWLHDSSSELHPSVAIAVFSVKSMTDYSDDAFAEIGAFEIDPSLHPAYHGLPPETSDAQIISGFESPKRLHSFWFSLFQRAWGNRRLCGAVSRPSGKARKWWFSGRNMWVYRLKERFSGRNMSVYRLKERLLGCRWCPQRSIYGGSLWFLGTHYVTTSSFTSDDDDDDEGRHIERNAEFEADFHSRVYITYRKGV